MIRTPKTIRAEAAEMRAAAMKAHAGEVRGALGARASELEELAALLEHGNDKPSREEIVAV